MTWSNATSLKVQFFHPLRFPLARLLLSARCFLGRYPSLSTPPLPVTQRGIEDSPGHWAGSLRFTHGKRLRVALFWYQYMNLTHFRRVKEEKFVTESEHPCLTKNHWLLRFLEAFSSSRSSVKRDRCLAFPGPGRQVE